MSLILDAGALIAYEAGERRITGLILEAQQTRVPVRTSTVVAAQVWRAPQTQVRLTRLLRGVDERVFDADSSQRSGHLLAASGTSDVADASLVTIAHDGDTIATSDPHDIAHLADHAGLHLVVVTV